MKSTLFIAALILSCLNVSAQQKTLVPKPITKSAASSLDKVVATVGTRKITRRDVILTYAESDPRVLGSFLLERYPTLQMEMHVSLAELGERIFTQFPEKFEGIVQELMATAAIEQAAQQKGITTTEAEIAADIHESLELRRKSAELPPASDTELIKKLNERPTRLRLAIRRKLLTDRLVVADIERKLGHKLTPEDFFRLKMIYIEAPAKDTGLDFARAKTQADIAYKEIIQGKKTFEQAAKDYSTDGSRLHDASIGVLPRTYLKTDIENAVMKLKPGAMTAPLQAGNGYGIFRLEASGNSLPEEDRRKSLQFVSAVPKKINDALAWALKDIPWTTTIGKPPEWIRQSTPAN